MLPNRCVKACPFLVLFYDPLILVGPSFFFLLVLSFGINIIYILYYFEIVLQNGTRLVELGGENVLFWGNWN